MAPTEIRDRRRILRYRHLLMRQMVQLKNRVPGLLMETGVSYSKQRLHNVGYFRELLTAPPFPSSIFPPIPAKTRKALAGRCRVTTLPRTRWPETSRRSGPPSSVWIIRGLRILSIGGPATRPLTGRLAEFLKRPASTRLIPAAEPAV